MTTQRSGALGDADRIGDDDLSVAGWMRLLERAGFELMDVLLRDADQVVIGALKSVSGEPGAGSSPGP